MQTQKRLKKNTCVFNLNGDSLKVPKRRPLLLRRSAEGKRDRQDAQHALEGTERLIKFSEKISDGRDHLRNVELHGRLILKFILKKFGVGLDWIQVTNDRRQWRRFVNTTIKPLVS
jgi:hypothetical protein